MCEEDFFTLGSASGASRPRTTGGDVSVLEREARLFRERNFDIGYKRALEENRQGNLQVAFDAGYEASMMYHFQRAFARKTSLPHLSEGSAGDGLTPGQPQWGRPSEGSEAGQLPKEVVDGERAAREAICQAVAALDQLASSAALSLHRPQR